MKGKLWKIFNFLLLSFCSLLLVLYSTISDVSAFELSPDVWLVTWASDPQVSYRSSLQPFNSISSWSSWTSDSFILENGRYLHSIALRGNPGSSLAYGFTWKARDFFSIQMTFSTNPEYCGFFDTNDFYNKLGSTTLDIIDSQLVANIQTGSSCTFTFQYMGQMWSDGSGNLDLTFNQLQASNSSALVVYVNSVQLWRYQQSTVNVDVDTQSVVNSIKDSQAYQQATTNAVNSAKEQAHADAQAQKEAIDNQTKQQQEQYDKDKQEEQDRENNLDDSSNSIGRLFNFNLINPLSGIFGLFSDGSICANIPTIASWVHSKDSVVCPWFPDSVRSVLTPVFGLSSTMILLYFVVHWSLRLTETT